ncbi:hypothetical protein [Macrococcus capreoli]|uniref:hypothetical protein n=1 Tax=Macrococcus capreoli TaxID=2982690 RepID=UPI0021D58D5C|nr:hypothetical protein [Macrococcus sp. TMW 2.2395]MCU7557630.1 hypothetical protein [Macrococcus sp. TMW 2.2395]
MTEFTSSFLYSEKMNKLDYHNYVILRFHKFSKRKICKMYKIAYFCILDICEKARKDDYIFTFKDYLFLKEMGVSNDFICKMYQIEKQDLEFFEVMNK